MKPRALKRIIAGGLLLLILWGGSYVKAAETGGMMPGIEAAMLSWEISNARMVDAGVTQLTDEGVLIRGVVIRATAEALEPLTPVTNGEFNLNITIFSPNEEMPGQRAGAWYLQGDWTIIDKQASREAKKSRYSSFSVKGSMSAELSFNPLSSGGVVEAEVILPRSPQGGRWASGEGTFYGNEKFEGTIQIDALIWPDVTSGG